MQNSDLLIMLIAAIGMGAVIYININKISKNIDKTELSNENYDKFCYFIISQVQNLKNDDENFNEYIDDFTKEIKFLINMNKNSSKEIYSQKITATLIKLNEYLIKNNKENIANELNEKFKNEFNKLNL